MEAGFAGDDAFIAVFPSLSTRPWPALITDFGSGMCFAGLVGDDAFHAVFPSVVDRPWMLCIVAGTAQKDSYAAGFHAPVPGSHLFDAGLA